MPNYQKKIRTMLEESQKTDDPFARGYRKALIQLQIWIKKEEWKAGLWSGDDMWPEIKKDPRRVQS